MSAAVTLYLCGVLAPLLLVGTAVFGGRALGWGAVMGAAVRPDPRPTTQRGPFAHDDAARFHALKRLRERYDITLRMVDVQRHAQLIRAGVCRSVSRDGTRVLHAVEDSGRTFYALWDRRLGEIVTYLSQAEDIGVRRDRRGRS